MFIFLVTPCLAVTVQPCLEWIPIKNKMLVRKNIWPPWLMLYHRLLKLASVYKTSWNGFGSKSWKRIWFFWSLKYFTTLFSSITSQIFMLLTLVLILHVSKLMSGLKIPHNQLSWSTNDQIAEMFSCGIFTSFSVSWFVINKIGWIALA